MIHKEHHRSHRSGWLRAAVLGANDGIVSTSSLILGVAAAATAQSDILLAGVAYLLSALFGRYHSLAAKLRRKTTPLALEQSH